MAASCNGCGNCCNPVVLAFETYADMLYRSSQPDPLTDPETYGDEQVAAIAHRFWLNGQWAKHKLKLVSVDEQRGRVVLECSVYDRASGRCGDYESRPPTCQGYPWYGIEPLAAGRLPAGVECSFWEDVPLKLRPEGWRPISEDEIRDTKGWSTWSPGDTHR